MDGLPNQMLTDRMRLTKTRWRKGWDRGEATGRTNGRGRGRGTGLHGSLRIAVRRGRNMGGGRGRRRYNWIMTGGGRGPGALGRSGAG